MRNIFSWFRVLSPMPQGEDTMRSHTRRSAASAQIGASRRLTLKPHPASSPASSAPLTIDDSRGPYGCRSIWLRALELPDGKHT